MKRLHQIPHLLILNALLVFFLVGCVSPKAAAYKTLASIGYSVDGAMKAWGNYVAQGKATPELRAKIIQIHDVQFNPAYTAAIQAAKFDYASAAPDSLVSLSTQLITAIDAVIHPKQSTTP